MRKNPFFNDGMYKRKGYERGFSILKKVMTGGVSKKPLYQPLPLL